jgi:phosphoglycolate phosphatase
MRYRLLIFDWDGTVMDSAARIVTCLRSAFDEVGAPLPAVESCRDVIGLGLDEAMGRLWPEASASQRMELMQRYRYRYLVVDDTPTPLFEQAAAVISGLSDAGYLLAVATGKSRRGLDNALAESGLAQLFHATRCADETFSKPDPQMVLELLDELGTDASEALMIGDTEYDLQMARNAGIDAVAAGWGVHTPERLAALDPLVCLSHIGALPAWLQQAGGPAAVSGSARRPSGPGTA